MIVVPSAVTLLAFSSLCASCVRRAPTGADCSSVNPIRNREPAEGNAGCVVEGFQFAAAETKIHYPGLSWRATFRSSGGRLRGLDATAVRGPDQRVRYNLRWPIDDKPTGCKSYDRCVFNLEGYVLPPACHTDTSEASISLSKASVWS